MQKQGIGMIVLVCLLGALVGTVLGRLLVELLPGLAGILTPAADLSLNLEVLSFGLRFNLAAVLGVAGALLVYRKL
jgi:hypothetical protein